MDGRLAAALLTSILGLIGTGFADDLLSSNPGLAFGRSSREPKFKIEYHSQSAPFHPSDDTDHETVLMSNRDGHTFECFLPVLEETRTVKAITRQNSSSVILETEKLQKLKTPDELIAILKDKCFYRHEGWWSYEFCYQQKLRQIHLENDKVVQEFILGVFDPEATAAFNENHSDISAAKDPRSKDASQRYHAHIYTNGTTCDLTDSPRVTEVRFVCSEHAVLISSIKEISTCRYMAIIQCPMLCRHPMFQQERPSWHTIHCNEMPPASRDSVEEDGAKGKQIILMADGDDGSEHIAT